MSRYASVVTHVHVKDYGGAPVSKKADGSVVWRCYADETPSEPMPSPFPGMDPYLEHPDHWPGFHNLLIARLAETLGPVLRPRYYVAAEERVYVVESPDGVWRPDLAVREAGGGRAENGPVLATRPAGDTRVLVATLPMPDRIRETYLEVRATSSREAVTAIELLSASNKRTGKGRQDYLEKRLDIVGTRTNLVEIDLLRAGEPMPAYLRDWPPSAPPPGTYRILVARGHRRPLADIYAFSVRETIPVFPLPLRSNDEEPSVDLQLAFNQLYDTLSYDLRIDYRAEPFPPLDEEDDGWADALLCQAARR